MLWEDNKSYTSQGFNSVFDSISGLVRAADELNFRVHQGYLDEAHGESLREELGVDVDFDIIEYRLREVDWRYYFTLKSDGDLSRREHPTEIDGITFGRYWGKTNGNRVDMLKLRRNYGGRVAVFSVYQDRDLITAEVEVPSIDLAAGLNPLGLDKTMDGRYKNRNMGM